MGENLHQRKESASETSSRGEPLRDGEGTPASSPPVEEAPAEGVSRPETTPTLSVVGIGASAGGLDANTRLLQALPVDTGMAFVLVQHLSPSRPSALAEILSRATSMPVAEVTERAVIEPNRVYVIPPDRNMVMEGGRLQLLPREVRGLNHPIDQFFRSLAASHGPMAIGVVLSGTASDGTLGLEEIKAEGGITFAQDDTAQQPGMPQSAVASGCVDFVLPPEGIAGEIARIATHPFIAPRPRGRGEEEAKRDVAEAKEELAVILRLLRNATDVDFMQYRVNTLSRRIRRRMVLQKCEGLGAYAQLLRESSTEVGALYQDILISVTSFFRDPEVFEALKAMLLPALQKERSRNDSLRFWVLGCSTGEEAYSFAMILSEAMESSNRQAFAQVFATDLNASSIAFARAGVYAKERLQDVSRERLRRFFVESEGSFRVAKPIREMCVFSRHNVMADPPFSRMDFISCRNLLIYLEPAIQQRIIPLLHYALKPKGSLILGASETVGRFKDLFTVEDGKHKIFGKRPGSGRLPLLPVSTARPASPADAAEKTGRASNTGTPARTPAAFGVPDVHKEADRLLATFAPPAVLVDWNLEILQFRGNTEPYLVPAPGKASLALLKMVREGLLVPLRALLHRAKQENAPVREEGLRVKSNEGPRRIDLEVFPVKGQTALEPCFLILFKDASPAGGPGAPAGRIERRAKTDAKSARQESSEAIIARLEHELAGSREHLQALIEQHEAASEELQSSNEEAQSANEELQSINEELETSKEEIQSTNEELTTVNDELHNRNLESAQLNSDLTNLISSVHVAIVIVGRDLRIRRFSAMAEKLLNIIPTDVGRPITDIRMKLDCPDLDALLTQAIDTIAPQERELQGRDGRWYSLRIRPYLTVGNKIDGAVLSLIDIDAIQRAREYAESIVATVREPLLVLDAELRVRSASRAFYESFGGTREETEGRLVYELRGGGWDIPKLRRLLGEILPRESVFNDLVVEHEFEGLGHRTLLLNARTLREPGGELPSILLSIEDITARKEAEEALRESEERFASIFNQTTGGIGVVDLTGRFVLVNERFGHAVGRSREVLLKLRMQDITHPDDVRDNAEKFNALVEGRGGNFVVEKRYLRPDGSAFWAHDDVAAIRDAKGKVRFIVAVVADITERKRLEEHLRARNEELAAADGAKNQFIAVLSHELRSPLNAIRGWIQLLQRPGTKSDDLRTGLEVIDRSSKAQAQLIDDLLDVYRISAGKIRLELAEVDLRGVVDSVVDAMTPAAVEKDVRIDREIDSGPAVVLGDSARLQQVLGNLLGNALKFTTKGGQIRVALRSSDTRAELSVSDTGLGISAAALPHVFERFRQADPLTSRYQGGLGLGLAIAKQLAELHGGTISAHSPGKGQGATFTVSLPLRISDASHSPALVAGATKVEPVSLDGILVLIVDDEPDAREPLRRVMEGAGAEAMVVASADEALAAVRERRPDVIVSDIGLPGRDGYDLMRSIRALSPRRGGRTPAIALTAYVASEDRDHALRAGFQTHLAKPIEAAQLLAAVAALVSRDPGAGEMTRTSRA